MNDTIGSPTKGPEASDVVVTESGRRWLQLPVPGSGARASPTDQGAMAEGEAAGARGHPATHGLLWQPSAGVGSSQRSPEARESGSTTRSPPAPSLLYSRRAASLRPAGPSPSGFSLRRVRPLASRGHAHGRQKRAFHWPSPGGGAGERRASPVVSFGLQRLRLGKGRWRRPCGRPCVTWAVPAVEPHAALLGASSGQAGGRPGGPGFCAGVAAAPAPGKRVVVACPCCSPLRCLGLDLRPDSTSLS